MCNVQCSMWNCGIVFPFFDEKVREIFLRTFFVCFSESWNEKALLRVNKVNSSNGEKHYNGALAQWARDDLFPTVRPAMSVENHGKSWGNHRKL